MSNCQHKQQSLINTVASYTSIDHEYQNLFHPIRSFFTCLLKIFIALTLKNILPFQFMLKFLKSICTILLLLTFLATTVGVLPVYALCFGEDGHVELEYSDHDICDEDKKNGNSSFPELAIDSIPSHGDHCTPCVDIAIQTCEATSTKRHSDSKSKSVALQHLNVSPLVKPAVVKLLVGNLVPQPPPRVSQTIIHHRTIVLLT